MGLPSPAGTPDATTLDDGADGGARLAAPPSRYSASARPSLRPGTRRDCVPFRPNSNARDRSHAGRSGSARRGSSRRIRESPAQPRRRQRGLPSRAPRTGRLRDKSRMPYLTPIGVIGMAGAEPVLDLGIILRALIGIPRSQARSGVPVVRPSNTPLRIFTASASCRWVVKRDWPGLRRSRPVLDIRLGPGPRAAARRRRRSRSPARGFRPRW